MILPNNLPDKAGYFVVNGKRFGGKFVPETVMAALEELEIAYYKLREDEEFQRSLKYYLELYGGRPTPLYYAQKLSELFGMKIYLKREDLLHTGAHKLNNTIAQVLLAKRMGKRRVIAETGAGQHGVATATAAALFGIDCEIYMGAVDHERQALNVFRMQMLGAKVHKVYAGTQTLKDAISEAIRDWVTNVKDTHYVIGSVVGPHPYPMLVRDFQAIIGKEARQQILSAEGRLPEVLVACVGGGSNAIGLFHAFYNDTVEFIGVEAEGAASLCKGSPGVLHGSFSYILQDEYGQILPTHSIAAGLDYPGVGPEHSFYKESGRAKYSTIDDESALFGFKLLTQTEGIMPALEPAHAIAYLYQQKELYKDKLIIVNLSGRGDKDVELVSRTLI